MPELAEVKLVSDFINDISHNNNYVRAYTAEGCKVTTDLSVFPGIFNLSSSSRGKELMIEAPQVEKKLLINLGMSGTWAYLSREATMEGHPALKHARLIFESATGGILFMHDQRHFGKWRWVDGWSKGRGPDPVFEHQEFSDLIMKNYGHKDFDRMLCEVMMSQTYFNGIGNYLRSTIIYHLGVNPFMTLNDLMSMGDGTPIELFLKLCKEIPEFMYKNGGGQLRDWKNPFGEDSTIDKVVFYNRGASCKDATGRTFWFDPVWKELCPFEFTEKKVR